MKTLKDWDREKNEMHPGSDIVPSGWLTWLSLLVACWFIITAGVMYTGGAEAGEYGNFQVDGSGVLFFISIGISFRVQNHVRRNPYSYSVALLLLGYK